MEFLAVAAATLMQSLCNNLPSTAPTLHSICHRDLTTDLGPQLSPGAKVYYPGSLDFDTATTRWSTLGAPNVTGVVEVATENDLVQTVKFANTHNIPFITYNGGHGAITSVGAVKNGIEISLSQLTSISIADNGKTATFGGGVKSKRISNALWAAGKQTVIGGCECTSLLGPGLGGGHGFLQGMYRLIAGQFVELRMVLADGSLITGNETSPLWWAVKGAGHNFGIVTSVTSKIYDVPDDGLWSYQSFVFTHDKVEGLYTAIDEYLLRGGTQPVGLINYSFFFNHPGLDAEHSLIAFFILRQGVESVQDEYTSPFINLGPVHREGDRGTFQDIPGWTGLDTSSAPCQKPGLTSLRFPVDLQQYDPTAQRLAFDTFSNFTHENPAFSESLFLFEGFSLQGVQNIDPDSTAFPHREANLLLAPVITYEPKDEERDVQGREFGEKLRRIVFQGSGQDKMYSYVNYALGNEGPQVWYGYEPWRLERLRALKREYDPKGVFGFHAPFD